MDIDPILFVRSISESQAKVILALLFKRGGMTVEELERRTGIGRKALYKACEDLSQAPFYMLARQVAAHGKAIWMPASALLPLMSGKFFENPDVSRSPICLDVPPEERIQMCHEAPPGFENEPKMPPDVSRSPICAGSIKMIDDDINLINKDHHQSEPDENFPTIQTLLEGLSVIRGYKDHPGERWALLDIDDIRLPQGTTRRQVLACIVKIVGDRERLFSPIGVLRKRLCSKSVRSLPKDWRERLPTEYLSAIGVEKPATTEDKCSENHIQQQVDAFLRRR